MNPLLEQLNDIEGLDPISMWPLASGWWMVMVLGFISLAALSIFASYRLAFNRSWRYDTFQKLKRLELELTENSAKDTVMQLSEYLRRIALRRFSRNECAGLTGDEWLKWLKKHDPNEFDWITKGTVLIEVPYAPANIQLSLNCIKDLIQATREWVR